MVGGHGGGAQGYELGWREAGTKRDQKNQGRNQKLNPKAQVDPYFLLISAFYMNMWWHQTAINSS